MKIAIFTDIHGNVPALKSILDNIKKNNVDRIICLGDVVGLGPKSKDCLDMIMDNNIEMVLGNNELNIIYGTEIDKSIEDEEKKHYDWIRESLNEDEMAFLKNCKCTIEENINGKKFLFEHFLIEDDTRKLPFYSLEILKNGDVNNIIKSLDYDYIFVGHEHRDFNIDEGKVHLIDMGSSGCRHDNLTRYTLLDINDDVNVEIKNIPFNRDELLNDLNEYDYPFRSFLAKIFFGENF